jgi:hypothetical protein
MPTRGASLDRDAGKRDNVLLAAVRVALISARALVATATSGASVAGLFGCLSPDTESPPLQALAVSPTTPATPRAISDRLETRPRSAAPADRMPGAGESTTYE